MQRLHLLKSYGIRLKIFRLVSSSARFCALPLRLIFSSLIDSSTDSLAAELAAIAFSACARAHAHAHGGLTRRDAAARRRPRANMCSPHTGERETDEGMCRHTFLSLRILRKSVSPIVAVVTHAGETPAPSLGNTVLHTGHSHVDEVHVAKVVAAARRAPPQPRPRKPLSAHQACLCGDEHGSLPAAGAADDVHRCACASGAAWSATRRDVGVQGASCDAPALCPRAVLMVSAEEETPVDDVDRTDFSDPTLNADLDK
eukprot:3012110-Prymnesium_polylepis.1